MSNRFLSVTIPIYNEEKTIEYIFNMIYKNKIVKEIIIVDDSSTDGTRAILKEIEEKFKNRLPIIKVISHEKNKGKGAALRTGFKHITGDVVIIQDADLEYSPAEYEKLARPILDGKAEVVYGSRFLRTKVKYSIKFLANRILTLLTNLILNIRTTDMETCYKMFKANLLKKMHLQSDRFNIEPELTAKFVKNKCKIIEVPISYHPRTYSKGKKIGFKDGIEAIITILKYALFNFK